MTGSKPLKGLLVVSMEQAVAAPYCASRLADAGARVIKIERQEGDFARGYDKAARGQSSYFVWLNRGKESLVLDIKNAGDKALLRRILARADVFIQNLAPGAMARAGFGSAALREKHPRLITVDITGYGEEGELTLSAYQIVGGSGSGFRFFVIDKTSDVVITETKFRKSRPQYNPRDRFFARVVCQV